MTFHMTDTLHRDSGRVASILLMRLRHLRFSYDRDRQHREQGKAHTMRGRMRGGRGGSIGRRDPRVGGGGGGKRRQ